MSEALTILLVDAETGETVERELNSEELKQRKKDEANAKKQQLEQEAKAAARESALVKLADLGLTAEEIAAL